MNRLLRKVKKLKTVKDNYLPEAVTVFRRTVYGYKQDGSVNDVYVLDSWYEVYGGTFYSYQQPLKENEVVRRVNLFGEAADTPTY